MSGGDATIPASENPGREDRGSCCHKQNQLALRARKRVCGCGKAGHRHRNLVPRLYHVDEEFRVGSSLLRDRFGGSRPLAV